MAKNRTDKSCYESQYEGGWVTGAQRLAEIACERKAESQDETLNPVFWQSPPWATQFRQQINHANNLLKTFSMAAVLAALRRSDARRVYSLGAPFFKPLVQMEQHKLTLQEKRIENAKVIETGNTKELPRPVRKSGRSVRDKLNEL
jgi:hypothetical protein